MPTDYNVRSYHFAQTMDKARVLLTSLMPLTFNIITQYAPSRKDVNLFLNLTVAL